MTQGHWEVSDFGDGKVSVTIQFEGTAKSAAILLEQSLDEVKRIWIEHQDGMGTRSTGSDRPT